MSANKKHLLIIGGPTASGKTTLAIALAEHFDAPILSADSRQFYREMNVGTAKPSPEELAQAKHYFINNLSLKEPYTVSDFEKEALQVLKTIYKEQSIAILVGGSGLFIKAVCEGLDKFPDVGEEAKKEVTELYRKEGIEGLQKALAEADPDYFKTVDQQNSRRLIRALMVTKSSGQPYSSFLNVTTISRPFVPHYICLDMDREVLYERINKRVDLMMENGLLEEVRKLYPFKGLPAMQTVGYAELFNYLNEVHSLDTAIALIKRNSRRYAKRQMTWFRRDSHWTWFSPKEEAKIIAHLTKRMKEGEEQP